MALVCLGTLGWSRIAAGVRQGPWPALLGTLLVARIWPAPQITDIPAARYPWLAILALASFGVPVLVFLRARRPQLPERAGS